MDRETLTACWLEDGAHFEEREGECWIPMRSSPSGLTVHVLDRRYCGCMIAWRSDTGRKVRVAAANLFDIVTVEAR